MFHAGLTDLSWNDIKVNDYIEDTVHLICNSLFHNMQIIQQNGILIEKTIQTWSSHVTELQQLDDATSPCKITDWNEKEKYESNISVISCETWVLLLKH